MAVIFSAAVGKITAGPGSVVNRGCRKGEDIEMSWKLPCIVAVISFSCSSNDDREEAAITARYIRHQVSSDTTTINTSRNDEVDLPVFRRIRKVGYPDCLGAMVILHQKGESLSKILTDSSNDDMQSFRLNEPNEVSYLLTCHKPSNTLVIEREENAGISDDTGEVTAE